jgi:hypothetical protein
VQRGKIFFRPVLVNHIFIIPNPNKKNSINTAERPKNEPDNFNIEKSHASKDTCQNDKRSQAKDPESVEAKEKNIDWWESLFLLKSPILNLLQAAPQIFSLREININGTGSLNNPMQTGISYGFQQILSLFSLERINIEFTPSFHPATLNGKIQLKLHLYMIMFVFFILRFIIHLLYLRLLNRLSRSAVNSGKAVN